MTPDVRSILAQAVGHHQAGRLGAAAASYCQALALAPDLAAAHYNLGNVLYALGKLDEADASYRRALALQPDLAAAHNNLGGLLLARGRMDEALASYRAALALQPDYAEALNNLGAALCRQGALDEGEGAIRRALALKPSLASAYDNLGMLLRERGRHAEAEASVRHALALAPEFPNALASLGLMLREQWRLEEAIDVYRRLLQVRPGDMDGLNGLASALAARGDTAGALEAIQQSLRIEETANTKRIFVEIVKPLRWTSDNRGARDLMARALREAWARPSELAGSCAGLVKQDARIGAAVARAAKAWPRSLKAGELFGSDGAKPFADDALLLALLTSAQNTDIELERFLTLARLVLLDAAQSDAANDAGLEFYAALACQCFINEYVFFQDEAEIHRAGKLRDVVTAALDSGARISPLQLLAVAAYIPLHSISGAVRLLDRQWPGPLSALLLQQVREPREEAALRTAIPRLTPIADATSRLVQEQYEENPYPRWVRMPRIERATTIARYLRRKFPLASFQASNGSDSVEFLSAGCGTGQLALEIAQGLEARVLAVDLSLSSLGYAKRKALELGLSEIEFAQADILALGTTGRRFDIVECSGVLHHMADPLAGWRALLSLLNPGGFMLVALYSEAARQGIVEARRFIAEKGYGTSAGDIRRCRQDLLEVDAQRKLGTGFGDFFGTSSCRDLLFHVQERRMTSPAIAAFLRDNDLTFLGFETDGATLQAYRRRFPDDPAATNLQQWNLFENEKPDTFARMYVFWMQKRVA